MKMPELLAPAGGKAHLKAAVNNGADAVYMGGLAFNARIFADNFRDEELPEAIEYAHLHGVRTYITLNTLLPDKDLRKAFEYADHLYSIGADGLIVQDMGLARLVHKYLPDFPLHLSTQGTLYNTHALGLMRDMGFCRVVPARELSLEEIRELSAAAEKLGMDVEIFVHGALCMSYSGQCQMSRMLGKGGTGSCRSGNRGTCAQPCRQPYKDSSGRTYYALSPKDLCLVGSIPDLVQSGAASFKIEGRIKSPAYVATVTRIYRKYIDLYADLLRQYGPEGAAERYAVDEEDMLSLRQIFNRGDFTEGYLRGDPGEDLLSGVSPKNQGLYAGRVIAVIDSEAKTSEPDEQRAVRGALKRGKVLACIAADRNTQTDEIRQGDGLEFRGDDDWAPREPVGGIATFVKDIGGGEVIAGDFARGLRTGDSAFKVTDHLQVEAALSAPDKKLPATMVFTARKGQFPVLAMTDVKSGYTAEITADHVVEAAIKVPTDAERVKSGLSRLGDTPYDVGLTGIDVQIDDDIMMPASIINRMRREASDELVRERTEGPLRGRSPLVRSELDVIESREMLGAVCLDTDTYAARIAADAAAGRMQPMPLRDFVEKGSPEGRLPFIRNVSKGALDRYIEENFDRIAAAVRGSGILIGNPGWIQRFIDAGVKVYGDYGLNVFNEQARRAFEEAGVELYMLSHETGVSDGRGIPLMISEHQIDSPYLTDRKGAKHRIMRSEDKTLIY